MSAIHILRAQDYRRTRWKNGGGETREIAISPAGATLDAFDWRLSVGHVASDGPFSPFPSIDRTIAVLSGAGMRLSVDGASPVTLSRTSPPYAFSGDSRTSAILVGGPIDDLNVMSHRARYSHRVTRRPLSDVLVLPLEADIVALLPRGGDVEILLDPTSALLANGDTGLVRNSKAQATGREAQIRPLERGVDLYVIELREHDR